MIIVFILKFIDITHKNKKKFFILRENVEKSILIMKVEKIIISNEFLRNKKIQIRN